MKKLGEILIERGLLTPEDLERALGIQRERSGEKIGRILIDLGFLAQRDLLQALSEQLGLSVAAMDGAPALTPETERLSPRFLRQARALPLSVEGTTLRLAMAELKAGHIVGIFPEKGIRHGKTSVLGGAELAIGTAAGSDEDAAPVWMSTLAVIPALMRVSGSVNTTVVL